MRCVLDHNEMIIIAESEFEKGYLGELLHNKMQGIATRDKSGNISKLSFHEKNELDIDEELKESSEAEAFVEEKDFSDILENFNATVVDGGLIELDDDKSKEINDLGYIEINDELDDIDFDDLDDYIVLENDDDII